MFFPHPVIEQLTPEQAANWKEHFAGDGHERPRSIEEGIWRRSQEPANAEQSGWDEDNQGRRRVVHYRYQYGLDYTHPVPRLVMTDLYLFHSITAPADEIQTYLEDLNRWLGEGRWRKDTSCWWKGDLQLTIADHDEHPQDVRAGRATPDGFRSVDVCFLSEGYDVHRPVRNLPWDVLAGGMRIKEQRGEPTIAADLSGLLDHLPFQVEVGCGTSIEAGIPPLHYLHEVYQVTDRRDDNSLTQSHRFTLAPASDTLVCEMMLGAELKAPDLVQMFKSCFLAEPTYAHRALKALHDAGHMVGPVISHNFDTLAARVGLEEHFVRRYDQKVPPVSFVPSAKSLLVIGLHADRRFIQARARERGMRVFFVDPEGLEERGVFHEYLIEGATAGDTVVRQSASPALERLCQLLDIQV